MSKRFEWSPFLTEILKNYKGISNQILLHAGLQVGTTDTGRSIYSFANLETELPNQLPIFSIQSFLLYIGLFDTPMVEFFLDCEDEVDHIIISDKDNPKRIFKYNLASTSEIANIDKIAFKLRTSNRSVTLLSNDIQNIIKAASDLESSNIKFTLEDNKLHIKTIPRLKGSHSLTTSIDCTSHEVTEEEDFLFIKEEVEYFLSVEQLKTLFKGDYEVNLFDDLISLKLISEDSESEEAVVEGAVNYALLFLDEDSI